LIGHGTGNISIVSIPGRFTIAQNTLVTAINCMDGRTQRPVRRWMEAEYGVDYVDMITEPGPDAILAGGDETLVASIKNRVLISVEKHGSKVVAIVAHGDCAGNPVTKDEHMAMLVQAAQTVKEWDLPVTIVGLWIDAEDWEVRKVF